MGPILFQGQGLLPCAGAARGRISHPVPLPCALSLGRSRVMLEMLVWGVWGSWGGACGVTYSVSAGEAEVHAAAVPRHVGRAGGRPGPGHGDLLRYSPPAPRQRPELRQEDPGLGGGGELVQLYPGQGLSPFSIIAHISLLKFVIFLIFVLFPVPSAPWQPERVPAPRPGLCPHGGPAALGMCRSLQEAGGFSCCWYILRGIFPHSSRSPHS